MKLKPAVVIGVLILLGFGYVQTSPLGGARVSLLDENGKPLTDHGKVYYSVWTFDENGSIKTLQRGTLSGGILKNLIQQGNVIKLNLDAPKGIAKKIGSKTAFIGVDVWVEKDGEVYTLPPESFETELTNTLLPENIELKFNLGEARKTEIAEVKKKAEVQPQGYLNPPWLEWRTSEQKYYENVEIPILIVHNNVWSDIFGTADLGATVQKYWGPDVTVALGEKISEKVEFDPGSIKVKALGRSITDYYAGGAHITVPKEHRWGYVWIRGTVRYIYQKEYICERDSNNNVFCSPTDNERYFAKIDSFTVDRVSGNIKHIASGSTLGKPPYNFPSSWMKRSDGISSGVNSPISISEFYGKIYIGSDGHSFGVGVPIGAILYSLSRGTIPPWFATVTVGFSVGDYSSYVMLGHLENEGPESQVTFYAMESNYKVEIPVNHWFWTSYEDVNVPVGLYVEVEHS
ncbi:hypothetical protein [Thermococcus waiotapuensis]|uniref:Uncharacterized protein n=1 Tax=Thermococcus waiotapuensis TaxID=90909 RepID=A0AAE4T3S6_9EURY|nr:hypothetical protein [Thermococcus waiotapuensis]MDV3104108.1 hypothetical protein [Thermococcus waiotapuensis]